MCITTTSLQHPNLNARLYGAIRKAANMCRFSGYPCGASKIDTRSGSIVVVMEKRKYNTKLSFKHNGKDITSTVKKALKASTESQKAVFDLGLSVDTFHNTKPVKRDVWASYSHL